MAGEEVKGATAKPPPTPPSTAASPGPGEDRRGNPITPPPAAGGGPPRPTPGPEPEPEPAPVAALNPFDEDVRRAEEAEAEASRKEEEEARKRRDEEARKLREEEEAREIAKAAERKGKIAGETRRPPATPSTNPFDEDVEREEREAEVRRAAERNAKAHGDRKAAEAEAGAGAAANASTNPFDEDVRKEAEAGAGAEGGGEGGEGGVGAESEAAPAIVEVRGSLDGMPDAPAPGAPEAKLPTSSGTLIAAAGTDAAAGKTGEEAKGNVVHAEVHEEVTEVVGQAAAAVEEETRHHKYDADFEVIRVGMAADNANEDGYFQDQKRQLAAIVARMDTAIRTFQEFKEYAMQRLAMVQYEVRHFDNCGDPITSVLTSPGAGRGEGGEGKSRKKTWSSPSKKPLKVNGFPRKYGIGETGNVQVACLSYTAANQRLASQGTGLQKLLAKDILPKLDKEITRLQQKRERLSAKAAEEMSAIDAQRAACKKAWRHYLETKRVNVRGRVAYPAKTAKDQHVLNGQDREGMVAYVSYQGELKKLQSQHAAYGAFLLKHLAAFTDIDTKRNERLRFLMVQFSQALINYNKSCAKTLEETLDIVESIEPEENHLAYASEQKINLLHEDIKVSQSGNLKKADHILPPSRDAKVVESLDQLEICNMGVMYYRFSNLGMKNWKPVFCLLSGRGVLHLFHKEGDERPFSTIGLRFCTIELAPSVHPNAFRIMETQPSIIGGEKTHKHAFRTGKQQTMAEWMVKLKRFLPSGTVEFTPREMQKFNKKRISEIRRQKRRSGLTSPKSPKSKSPTPRT